MYMERGSNMSQNTVNSPFEGCVGYPIGMAYVPVQKWQNIYKAEAALMKGTVFPELYLPFLGKEALMNGR
jgi:hypothetical protein